MYNISLHSDENTVCSLRKGGEKNVLLESDWACGWLLWSPSGLYASQEMTGRRILQERTTKSGTTLKLEAESNRQEILKHLEVGRRRQRLCCNLVWTLRADVTECRTKSTERSKKKGYQTAAVAYMESPLLLKTIKTKVWLAFVQDSTKPTTVNTFLYRCSSETGSSVDCFVFTGWLFPWHFSSQV